MAIYTFIDLFGTLGGNGLDDIRNFEIFDFSFDALSIIMRLEIKIVIITNQSGIGKGEYSINVFEEKKNQILKEFNNKGISIYNFLYCPHKESDNCLCKKPKIGLLSNNFNDCEYSKSYVIGDMGKTDMLLAKNIGAKGILVKTGVGMSSLGQYRYYWKDYEPYCICKDIKAASHFIENDFGS